MSRAYPAKPEFVDKLPAITHVDGTARVQTVNERQNPRYYRLIKEFGQFLGRQGSGEDRAVRESAEARHKGHFHSHGKASVAPRTYQMRRTP